MEKVTKEAKGPLMFFKNHSLDYFLSCFFFATGVYFSRQISY